MEEMRADLNRSNAAVRTEIENFKVEVKDLVENMNKYSERLEENIGAIDTLKQSVDCLSTKIEELKVQSAISNKEIDEKPRSLRLEVRKLRLKIFLPLPRSNTRRTCCCPGHSTRKPRSYRLEARTLHLDPGLLPLEGLRTTLDIVKKKNRESKRSQIWALPMKNTKSAKLFLGTLDDPILDGMPLEARSERGAVCSILEQNSA
ncbi:unnamed protein product [Nesidiocoris tenuis]|uniref:Uncharacterized protein n=1 Tax=Nesidiocoris tenuis TaxID=355587 RepID=A0A6H5HUU6_9HEMI|nr:unnamed protein product [Nesidiocoris tenuis]